MFLLISGVVLAPMLLNKKVLTTKYIKIQTRMPVRIHGIALNTSAIHGSLTPQINSP